MRRSVRGEDGEVGLAAEPVVQRAEQVRGGLVGLPGVLEPARADLRVGTAVDAPFGAIRGAQALVVGEVAVMAERVAALGIVERLGVLDGQRREARRPAQVDERRVVSAVPTASRPGSSRKARTSRYEASRAVAREPRGTPAEAGQSETLESLGERPQLVEPERLGGAGDEVLTHRAR